MMKRNIMRLMGAVLALAMLVTVCALPVGALAEGGYAATPLDGNSGAQLRNIERVINTLSGYVVVNGGEFSFKQVVGDRSKERGYENAVNGRGAKMYGGGSGQVAAALYLAVKDMKGIYIDELHTYGDRYTGSYVDSGDDAVVVDWQAGTDFIFTNNTGNNITIYAWIDDDELRVSVDESGSVLGYGTTEALAAHPKIPVGIEVVGHTPHENGSQVSVRLHIDANGKQVSNPLSGEYSLVIPGEHMVLNSAAAVLTGVLTNGGPADLARGIAEFSGVRRRFEYRGTVDNGEYRGTRVYDDYAHNPEKLRAM